MGWGRRHGKASCEMAFEAALESWQDFRGELSGEERGWVGHLGSREQESTEVGNLSTGGGGWSMEFLGIEVGGAVVRCWRETGKHGIRQPHFSEAPICRF